MPEIFIIAGPNGAGKTTASFTILPEILGITQFINADEIAKGLSPFEPESVAIQAGRLMLNRIKYLLEHSNDFAFETTLSTKSYVNLIRKAHLANYKITLVFFYLDSSELAIERVKKRVLKGGHFVPDDTIRRRYVRGIYNLKKLYMDIVDNWMVFDNSNNQLNFVAEYSVGKVVNIYNPAVWNKILAL